MTNTSDNDNRQDDAQDNAQVNDANNETQNQPTDINALIVKLPTFWQNNPTTWFIQAEAQFSLGKITADISKYNYVVATLPQDIAESVSDVLENPPNTGLYAHLKKQLIDRHSLSLESRIQKLISGEEIGDRKPSDFFRTLQRLAGNNSAVGIELLKKLWMSKLPQAINIALIPQSDGEIAGLMALADQVWEAIKTANISAVKFQNIPNSSACSSSSESQLRSEINELKLMIEKISADRSRSRYRSPSGSRSRSGNRPRSQSRRRFNPNGKFCYDHFRYGRNADNCEQPCSFRNRSQNSNRNGNNSSNSSNNNSNNHPN